MPSVAEHPANGFDEADWLRHQKRRGEQLYGWVDSWLSASALPEPLRTRVHRRALPGGTGRVEGPPTFVLCAAESMGAPEVVIQRLGIAATFFWAAADVADDVDDGELSGGEQPEANDGCALLFLSMEALQQLGPHAVQMGIAAGLRMAGGQAMDLRATGRPHDYDPVQIARDKAGAEFGFFLALAAEQAGLPVGSFSALGEALGVALQIFSDVADLYMSPQSLDLLSAKGTPILQSAVLRDRPRLERLLAADRVWPDLQASLRYEMREDAVRSLAGLETPVLRAWGEVEIRLEDPKPLRQLVDWILGLLVVTRGALDSLEEPPATEFPSLHEALARGTAYLSQEGFTERHIWGLFGKPQVDGNLLPAIFSTAALRSAGAEWMQGVGRLLELRDGDGWRYYPHNREIPCDADDTGMILGYFGDALPPAVREATVRQLLAAYEGGAIHTWLVPAESEIEWEGDDCLATLANATWGLLRNGAGDQVPHAVWERLIAHATKNEFASPFYTDEATRYFVHRCLSLAAEKGCIGSGDAKAVCDQFALGYYARVRWGGSTSDSVMNTAFDILTARAWGIVPEGDVQTYFAARQWMDGSWPREPLFMSPSIAYRPMRWGHDAITTAVVVLALSA